MSYARGALVKSRVRSTKFTAERIQHIKDFVECGSSCEEIAALVGVTVGTLKVTCSRLGISLRRPRSSNGSRLLPLRPARAETAGVSTATFTISMRYKGQEQNTALPLTTNMISQLALEAAAQDKNISEFAKDLVQAVTERGLVQKVLEE